MNLVEVDLKTNEVEPGWPMTDKPLGTKYVIDLDDAATLLIINYELGKQKHLRCVLVVDPGPPGYFPTMAFGL